VRTIEIAAVLEDFERLIEEAAQGNGFIISVDGVPKVKVVAYDPAVEEERNEPAERGDQAE
jgi:antitoxin (DNA-binding transcriptional repressor) of toxin-antitoxin stability system